MKEQDNLTGTRQDLKSAVSGVAFVVSDNAVEPILLPEEKEDLGLESEKGLNKS